jgi:hypothetical protein
MPNTSSLFLNASLGGSAPSLPTAQPKVIRKVPLFPPKPASWGKGKLTSAPAEFNDPIRLQRCADQDAYHIIPGEVGRHVYAVQHMLVMILAFSNPALAAELRGERKEGILVPPHYVDDTYPPFKRILVPGGWEVKEKNDVEIIRSYIAPFEQLLRSETVETTNISTYGPNTMGLVLQWKTSMDLKTKHKVAGQPDIDPITGIQTIRSLDFYMDKFVTPYMRQAGFNNVEPWA